MALRFATAYGLPGAQHFAQSPKGLKHGFYLLFASADPEFSSENNLLMRLDR
jgi:hypothetical protein